MGLLGDLYSAIDTKKRQLKGLLADPAGTVDMGMRRFREDQQGLQNLFANAYPMAGDKTVLNNPQQIAQFQGEAADKAGEMGLAGATVWHGSPHKFDKFDSSKIGTGEGAQAYGHGLYLAENKNVAQGYKDQLSPRDITRKTQSQVEDWSAWAASNADDSADAMKKIDGLIEQSKSSTPLPSGFGSWDEFAAFAKQETGKRFGGSLYKVDLPDEHIAKMLDWDKPLSQQHPDVQKMLEPLGYSSKAQVNQYEDDLLAALTGDSSAPLKQIRDPMGSDIARGGGVFDGKGQVDKANKLRELGIPGIRYLDGGSRGTSGGTSNFVVFPGNEGLLNILERNGKPIGGLLK